MKILFATGTPYLPQVRGGVEINTHEIVTELGKRGHDVAVLARLSYKDVCGFNAGLSAGFRNRVFADDDLGYRVFRSREPWRSIAELSVPDIAVIQNGHPLKMTRAFAQRNVPVIVYNHGLGFESWTEVEPTCHPDRLGVAEYLSISRFTADRFRARYGRKTEVIPPVFRAERYRTPRRPKYVTFINPVAVKGVELALKIAACCPQIPFFFVKGWPLSPVKRARLKMSLSRLPNVVLRERMDINDVYRETRILLVPSQWEEETWGRVVSEAHYSGIPVVATDRGGLPESVGPGGVVIGIDEPLDRWTAEIGRLWNDDSYYLEKSNAALEYSRRLDLRLDYQIDRFEAVLRRLRIRQHVSNQNAPV